MERLTSTIVLNLYTLESDQHLISLYNNSPKSFINITRIKK